MIRQHLLKNLFPKRTKDFWLFELSTWLHIFAVSLTSIFIPILLYQAHFLLSEIILYLLALHFFNIPLNLLAEKIIYKKGSKIIIFTATLFNIFSLYLLSIILKSPTISGLILTSFFAALYDSFYYVSSLYTFIGTNEKVKNTSSNTAIFYAIITFAGLLSPFIGSYILILDHELALLYSAILIFFLSLIPLYSISKLITKPNHKPSKLKLFFKQKQEQLNFVNLSLFKFSSVSEIFIWPLYVFLTVGNIEIISSITLIMSISGLFFIFINSKIKKSIKKTTLITSIIIFILIWLTRLFFPLFSNLKDQEENFILITTFISSSLIYFISLPIDTNIFSRAKKIGPLASSTFKNMFSMLSKFIFFLVLYILSILINNDLIIFKFSFMFSILSLLVLLYYINKTNIK